MGTPAQLTKRLLAFVVVLSCFLPTAGLSSAQASNTPTPFTAQQWRDDLRFLVAQMREKHKNLFHTMTEAQFNDAVAKLDADIPHLNDDQIYVRFMQLMVLIQDGHSGIANLPLPGGIKNNTNIPLRFVRYPDGVYIRAAAPEYADVVGGKVINVGNVDWQEAMRRVDSVASHDAGNPGHALAWSAELYLSCPHVLHGLGLSDSPESAVFTIEKDGQSRTITMKPSTVIAKSHDNAVPAGWVDARPASVPVPLAYQHAERNFWFTELPEDHAIYFQFNEVHDADDETLAAFAQRLGAALQKPEVERIVIDLRNNSGGDNTLERPLLVALIRSHQNRRGGIWLITGDGTFSAAQSFVNRIGNYAEVIVVGQPTGENPNQYGDPAHVTLPNTQLVAAISTLWWQDEDPTDKRTATFPEIAIDPSFQQYVAGKDSTLEYALTQPAPQTLREALTDALPGGLNAVLASYQKFVGDPAHKYQTNSESGINRFGYELLMQKRVSDAITMFELNVREHPDSWNAWDSLGEGYMNARDKQRAIAAYQKSLELNPENTNGKQMMERIKQ
jgi:hypothetical protein